MLGLKKQELNRKIDLAVYRICLQMKKLEDIGHRLETRDKEIFKKCVEAQASGNTTYARLYATECSEIRKIANAVTSSKLSLEQGVLRLKTTMSLNSLFSELSHVGGILKSANVKVEGAPIISTGVRNIASLLDNILPEAQEMESVLPIEARGVLQEAQLVAEQKIGDRFPKPIPSPIPAPTPEGPMGTMQSGGTSYSEQDVRDYVKAIGENDPVQCSIDLGIPREFVEKVLGKLKTEG